MKIYTAKYKAEQPANKELHVPTDSRYGVGLQFEKDGQPWDLKPGEVTMNGVSADDVADGMFVFERTSGGCGQKVSDVRAADMGVHVSANNVVSAYNSKARIVQNYQAKFVDLSSILDEPVEVTYDQLKIWTRSGSSEEAMLSSDFFFWNDDINSMNYVSHTIFPCYAGGLSPFTYVYMWPYTR